MTTTTTTNIDAFDLRRALVLRAESDELIERLSAGDLTAEPRARELLATESAMIADFVAAMTEGAYDGWHDSSMNDRVYDVVVPICTGNLGYVLDVATGAAL